LPDGQSAGWKLAFSDEFNGSSLNRQKWDPWYPDTPFWNATKPGGHLTNTGEPQAYDPSAISFDGSNMLLTLRDQSTVSGIPYTSGMVTSYPSFSATYGYFEASIQLPRVQQSWPAFWMDPQDQSWPPEIDIMESWGTGGIVGQNYHGTSSEVGTRTGSTATNPGFNTFGLLWRADYLAWYVNGKKVYEYSNPEIVNKNMYIICNLAGIHGAKLPASVLPMTMKVDYIRAWQAIE